MEILLYIGVLVVVVAVVIFCEFRFGVIVPYADRNVEKYLKLMSENSNDPPAVYRKAWMEYDRTEFLWSDDPRRLMREAMAKTK